MSKRIKVKPGKIQSMTGLLAGIVFCLIGLIVVIPSFGLFGILWTLMALIITVTSGINAFSDKGVVSHEIMIEEEGQIQRAVGSDQEKNEAFHAAELTEEALKENIELRLRTAEDLYREETITKEEYEAKRREILKEL